MWLLNSCTWELEEFISYKQAPPYAILSHTWGDDEVSFRDWQREPIEDIRKKAGFSKINNCCQQAAADGLGWIWVDTCCIDKGSSAELSEAINSMFQWYKNAVVCYAYLCDVSRNIKSNLAKCRWVTRGWTLQELIAPREVSFYSKRWQPLGTRSELSAHLASVTGIGKQFLEGKSVHDASIAQRMSWAAKRKTSREEDETYCLLGIFDVNMPLLYGEGTKAFKRLQEILIREYPQDHSLFAWGKIVSKPSNLIDDEEQITHEPNQSNNEFFGLLAESPGDFKDSGQIVLNTDTALYFQTHHGASVLNLIGDAVDVELPVIAQEFCLPIHLKRPSIVQLIKAKLLILSCGQWDKWHTRFHYVNIPIITLGTPASRTNEIIVNDQVTDQKYSLASLYFSRKRLRLGRLLTPSAQNGYLVIKRISMFCSWSSGQSHGVTSHGTVPGFKILNSISGLLVSIRCQMSPGCELQINLIRLDALNHLHEDPSQARACGRLGFGLCPYCLPQPDHSTNTPISILREHRGPGARAVKEHFTPPIFPNPQTALSYNNMHWKDSQYKHNMTVPKDEWKVTIIGLADIRVSVERMYFDDDDSDDDESNGDKWHRFVDVVDIMVTENTDKDSSDEENGDNQDTSDEGSDDEGINGDNISNSDAGEENRLVAVRSKKRKRMNVPKRRKSKRQQAGASDTPKRYDLRRRS
ncbi:HET-domain-containing protein [Nemania abortiva]|nr:HET-domain-containing protein [Nemania abortiva]